MSFRSTFLTSMVTVCVCLPALAQKQISFPVEKFKLKNGLTVILYQDQSVPLISFQQWYRVGSRHEKPGRTGLAHFFEHLMFKGTKKMPKEKLEYLIQSKGGSNNAFTTRDYTGYYVDLPAGQLEVAMQIESDRMRNLIFDLPSIQSEREVVKEERRMRFDDSIDGAINEATYASVFKVHPYRWPVIGSMEDLNEATIEDLQAFYKSYYAPNNSVLVIAGSFDKSQAKSMVEKYYGGIKSEVIPDEATVEEPEQTEPRNVVIKKNVQSATLNVVFKSPKANEREAFDLDLLAGILGDGNSSRLYKRLVYDLQLATSVDVTNYTSKLSGVFEIGLNLKPGANVAQALAVVYEEIKKVQSALVTDSELVKAKNQVMMGYISGLRSVSGKAYLLALNEILFEDYSQVFKDLGKYEEVTADRIKDAATRFLSLNKRNVIQVLPEKKGLR